MHRQFEDNCVEVIASRGREEGWLDAAASALLMVLDARGISVTNQARALISGCSNLDELQGWTTRAATVTTIDEVFVPIVETPFRSAVSRGPRNDPVYWIRFGRIEGVALGLIEVLAARGVAVSDLDCDQAVEAFTIESADLWIRRALIAKTVEEFFSDLE